MIPGSSIQELLWDLFSTNLLPTVLIIQISLVKIIKNAPWRILVPRAVAYGSLLLRTSAHKKRQSMPTIHVLPPFYPIIYVIFSGHLPGSYLSFEAPATSPLSARSARTFGMTISPLKKSAKDHTSSSFRQEPITMQTTTISE